jgi:hypothetical protein
MDVIGHEDIRMNRAPAACCRFSEALQVEPAIDVAKETGSAIVASLDDVKRDPWQL